MATRFLEYGGRAEGGYAVVPALQYITEQAAMTASASSAQSAAVNAATKIVIVDTDEQIYVSYGVNPTATTNSLRIAASATREFQVPVGQSWKFAIRT